MFLAQSMSMKRLMWTCREGLYAHLIMSIHVIFQSKHYLTGSPLELVRSYCTLLAFYESILYERGVMDAVQR